MDYYNVKEISLMLDVNDNTLRTYLGHYSFDKFRKGNKFKVDNDFYRTLLKYVEIKRNYDYIEKIERLINE